MKAALHSTRVMVVSDNPGDAASILELLKAEYPDSRSATDVSAAVQAFEDFRPDVLILGFDTLAKAQAYSLRLYRLGQVVHQYDHRNVLLCHKDESAAAYHLYREGAFDDYVLFWPASPDALRLPMAVFHAARQLKTIAAQGPTNVELISHVKKIAAIEETLDQHEDDGERYPSSDSTAAPQLTLKAKLAPHLDGLRTLGDKVRGIKPLVMVVDDDDFAHKLATRALEGSPYRLVFAEDGATALALLRRTRPDLILMDVNLPDIDGLTLTQKLKAAPHLADIPVLMLTGDARRQTLESSVTAGAAGFVVKPFTPRALLDKLDRFLSTAP